MENTTETKSDLPPMPFVNGIAKFLYFFVLLAIICGYKYLTEEKITPSLLEILLLVLSVDLASIANTLYKNYFTNVALSEAKLAHMQVTAGFFSMIAILIGEVNKILEQKIKNSK